MNEELHQRTVEILTRLVDVLNCDDLSILCYHAGVREEELMPITMEVRQPCVIHLSREPF